MPFGLGFLTFLCLLSLSGADTAAKRIPLAIVCVALLCATVFVWLVEEGKVLS